MSLSGMLETSVGTLEQFKKKGKNSLNSSFRSLKRGNLPAWVSSIRRREVRGWRKSFSKGEDSDLYTNTYRRGQRD